MTEDGIPAIQAEQRLGHDVPGMRGLYAHASYRAVHLPRTDDLWHAGFPLLPSFGRPHFTIRLDGDDPAGLTRLLDALGPAEANRYQRRERPGRR